MQRPSARFMLASGLVLVACGGTPGNADSDGSGEPGYFCPDADKDGHGDAESGESLEPDEVPDGWTDLCDDCDDASADVAPGHEEVCDQVDNDCDGQIDFIGKGCNEPVELYSGGCVKNSDGYVDCFGWGDPEVDGVVTYRFPGLKNPDRVWANGYLVYALAGTRIIAWYPGDASVPFVLGDVDSSSAYSIQTADDFAMHLEGSHYLSGDERYVDMSVVQGGQLIRVGFAPYVEEIEDLSDLTLALPVDDAAQITSVEVSGTDVCIGDAHGHLLCGRQLSGQRSWDPVGIYDEETDGLVLVEGDLFEGNFIATPEGILEMTETASIEWQSWYVVERLPASQGAIEVGGPAELKCMRASTGRVACSAGELPFSDGIQRLVSAHGGVCLLHTDGDLTCHYAEPRYAAGYINRGDGYRFAGPKNLDRFERRIAASGASQGSCDNSADARALQGSMAFLEDGSTCVETCDAALDPAACIETECQWPHVSDACWSCIVAAERCDSAGQDDCVADFADCSGLDLIP